MKLYPWQRECLSAWESGRFRGIAHVVTGGGKTFLALNAMDLHRACFPDARVKIVVPTIPLAQQWQTALLHHVKDPSLRPGLWGGGLRDHPDQRVMIYILNSARGVLADHIRRDFSLGRHVLLICDECHHCQSPQNRRIFDFIHASYASGEQYASLGLSATPFGTANDEVLREALGPEICRYDVARAAADGIVSPFTVSEVAVSFLPREKEAYQQLSLELSIALRKLLQAYPDLQALPPASFLKAVTGIAHASGMDPENPAVSFLLLTWQRKEISVLADARLLCGLELVDRLPPEERILIFCERISQAERMFRLLQRKHGNTCALYHSRMSREARHRNMEAFRRNQAHILVSCRCLDEGLDVPEASTGIVLSCSAVSRQRIQRLGRLLRRSEGKSSATLYYLYIQESADDAAFLPGLDAGKTNTLRFRSQEKDFENDLYIYAAAELLREARAAGWNEPRIRELRRCLNEGLPRADYLLPEAVQILHLRAAENVHVRNYWQTMIRLGRKFQV